MSSNEKIDKLKEIVDNSNNIVFFGGAGVSTESGIPDFRSNNGIYNTETEYGASPEEILSHSYFIKNPEKFYDYYRKNLIFQNAKPNNCHIGLKKLEDSGKLQAIITQNIDGLHQKAGSENVLELHGSIYRNFCMKCGRPYLIDDVVNCEGIPRCKCGGMIKPDVVLYEEPLNQAILSFAVDYISTCDTLIVGGTSLVVNPAATLIQYFKGKDLVIINKDETPYDSQADVLINDNIGDVFKELMDL